MSVEYNTELDKVLAIHCLTLQSFVFVGLCNMYICEIYNIISWSIFSSNLPLRLACCFRDPQELMKGGSSLTQEAQGLSRALWWCADLISGRNRKYIYYEQSHIYR